MEIGVIFWVKTQMLKPEDEVSARSVIGNSIVGNALIGRVIDPLGKAMDDKRPTECIAIVCLLSARHMHQDRSAVEVSLQTGIKVIDA